MKYQSGNCIDDIIVVVSFIKTFDAICLIPINKMCKKQAFFGWKFADAVVLKFNDNVVIIIINSIISVVSYTTTATTKR
jgi:hypothetical protein